MEIDSAENSGSIFRSIASNYCMIVSCYYSLAAIGVLNLLLSCLVLELDRASDYTSGWRLADLGCFAEDCGQ